MILPSLSELNISNKLTILNKKNFKYIYNSSVLFLLVYQLCKNFNLGNKKKFIVGYSVIKLISTI